MKKLNKKIVNKKFPLTILDDALDRLEKGKHFFTLNMTKSFHQIELNKKSRFLNTFSVDMDWTYHSRAFKECSRLDAEAFIYVDDIIIHGCSFAQHNTKKYYLKLKTENQKSHT